jgi:hypothetical protein
VMGTCWTETFQEIYEVMENEPFQEIFEAMENEHH